MGLISLSFPYITQTGHSARGPSDYNGYKFEVDWLCQRFALKIDTSSFKLTILNYGAKTDSEKDMAQ